VLSSWDQTRLSQAFGVDPRAVASDALIVTQWHAPADDLMSFLEQKHRWTAATAYRYVRTLRSAELRQLPD
jgi:hypothetical protein